MYKNKDNLILIDKPKGITSFDIIRQLRKKLRVNPNTSHGQWKMGHAGTLDPNASGLMIIGVEKGTKKLKDLIGLDKVYVAEILLGKKTDSGDITGKIVEEKSVLELSKEKIESVLKSLVGDTVLEVSLYSAMKRKGKPLYKYAQKGEEVVKPKRVMTVIRADLKEFKDNIVTAEFEVGSGTYIRSLAEELGKRLGTVATLQNLRRVSIGGFNVEDAKKI